MATVVDVAHMARRPSNLAVDLTMHGSSSAHVEFAPGSASTSSVTFGPNVDFTVCGARLGDEPDRRGVYGTVGAAADTRAPGAQRETRASAASCAPCRPAGRDARRAVQKGRSASILRLTQCSNKVAIMKLCRFYRDLRRRVQLL